MLILGFFGIGMVYLFLPKGPIALDSRMFFLGAGFMLLETKAVVQLALLFGSSGDRPAVGHHTVPRQSATGRVEHLEGEGRRCLKRLRPPGALNDRRSRYRRGDC